MGRLHAEEQKVASELIAAHGKAEKLSEEEALAQREATHFEAKEAVHAGNAERAEADGLSIEAVLGVFDIPGILSGKKEAPTLSDVANDMLNKFENVEGEAKAEGERHAQHGFAAKKRAAEKRARALRKLLGDLERRTIPRLERQQINLQTKSADAQAKLDAARDRTVSAEAEMSRLEALAADDARAHELAEVAAAEADAEVTTALQHEANAHSELEAAKGEAMAAQVRRAC